MYADCSSTYSEQLVNDKRCAWYEKEFCKLGHIYLCRGANHRIKGNCNFVGVTTVHPKVLLLVAVVSSSSIFFPYLKPLNTFAWNEGGWVVVEQAHCLFSAYSCISYGVTQTVLLRK